MRIGVGVGVLILENDKILLGHRNEDKIKAGSELDGAGTWTMPGGKVEFDETIFKAAIRETKEETDLDISNLKIVSISDDFGKNAHYVTIGFRAENYSGVLDTKEPETITEWRWFGLHSLPDNLYPPSKKVITNFINGVNYSENALENELINE